MELYTQQYNKDLIIKEPVKCQDRSGGEKRTNEEGARRMHVERVHAPKCDMKRDSGSKNTVENGAKN